MPAHMNCLSCRINTECVSREVSLCLLPQVFLSLGCRESSKTPHPQLLLTTNLARHPNPPQHPPNASREASRHDAHERPVPGGYFGRYSGWRIRVGVAVMEDSWWPKSNNLP